MQSEKERIIAISDALYAASCNLSILRNIAWSPEVKNAFFKNHESILPTVEYPYFNHLPVLEQVEKAKKLIDGNDELSKWANRIAQKIEHTAWLLANRGKPAFFEHSKVLFGAPTDLLPNEKYTALDLANHFKKTYINVKNIDLGLSSELDFNAYDLKEKMEKAVLKMFGTDKPEIVLDPSISSNAIAGRRRIAIRPDAMFNDKDMHQLIHHEAYVHVATSINGYEQDLKILSLGHAGTTKTQEGLAVFAEYITGSTDIDRLQRLSDRVVVTQMVIDGADFIEIYRYYLDKTQNADQSFESAKRVFRGGVLTGGTPFTKDIVYLDGFLRVHKYLRTMISAGKFEFLDLLFCGKISINDIPALKHMDELGLIKKPKYLPPWIKDRRYLISYLAFSSFIVDVNSDELSDYYQTFIQ